MCVVSALAASEATAEATKARTDSQKPETDLTKLVRTAVHRSRILQRPFYCVCARKLKVLSHLQRAPRAAAPLPHTAGIRHAADVQGRFGSICIQPRLPQYIILIDPNWFIL